MYDPVNTPTLDEFQAPPEQQKPESTASSLLKILRSIAVPQSVQWAEQISPTYKQIAGRATQGFAGTVAGIPEAAAIISKKIGDTSSGLGLGRLGIPERVEDATAYKAGRLVRDAAQEVFPVDETRPSAFLTDTLPQAAGSMAGFMAGGAAGALAKAPAWITTAMVGAATGGASAYDEAKRMGGTDDQAWTAFIPNALVGTTEAVNIGKWMSLANKASGGTLLAAIRSGRKEAAQEIFQQVVGNVTASDIAGYDPNRPITQGLAESAAAGAILGGIGGAAFNRLNRPAQPPAIPQEQNATNPIQLQGGDVQKYSPVDVGIPQDRQDRNISSAIIGPGEASINRDSGTSSQGQPAQTEATNQAGQVIQQPQLADAPVVFTGHFPGFGDKPGVDLYTLTEAVPGLTKNTTISEASLNSAGFKVPDAVRLAQVSTNIEGASNATPSQIKNSYPVSTDNARVVGDLQSSGKVLWGTTAEIEQIITDAHEFGMGQQGTRTTDTGRTLESSSRGVPAGTKESRVSDFQKTRFFIQTDSASPTVRQNSEILAHRILFGGEGSQGSPLQPVGSSDFVQRLSEQTASKFIVRDTGRDTYAQHERLEGVGDFISINSRRLGELNFASQFSSFDAVLSEELLHSATLRLATDKEVSEVWDSLSTKEKSAVTVFYDPAGKVPTLSSLNGGSEYIRMILQDRLEGRVTEQMATLGEKMREILKRLVAFLKKAFEAKPTDNIARQVIERIESAIKGGAPISGSVFGSSVTDTRQSLVTSAAEAVNVQKLVRGPDERKIKAAHLDAQGEVATVLQRLGANTADSAVQNELNWQDYLWIRKGGEALSGQLARGYRQLKKDFAGNIYQIRHMALVAATQWRMAQMHMQGVVEAGKVAAKKVASKSWAEKLISLAKADSGKAASEYAYTMSGAVFDSALSEASKALKGENLSDLETAKLEGQLKEIQASKDSRFAIGQIMDDMVKSISIFKDGYDLLNDPSYANPTAIRDAYVDLKESTDQPVSDPKLVNWAARMLARSSSLRQKVLAAQLAQDSNVRSALGPYAASLATELEKDPAAAVRKWRSEAVKLATTKQKAAYVYRQLRDEMSDEMEKLSVADDAAKIAQAWLDDPARKELVVEIRKDALIDANEPSVLPMVDELMMLPSGKSLELNAKTGDALKLSSKRAEIRDAAHEIETWLENNPQDENYGTHARNLQTLMDFYAGSMLLNPQGDRKFFNRAFGILRQAANLASSVVGEQFRKTLVMLDKDYNKAVRWRTGYSPKFTTQRVAAMKSHGLKWGVFFGKSLEEANLEWVRRIGNELASGHSNGEQPLKIGDKIGQHGDVITKEDMADLESQSNATTLGYELMGERQVTERTLGNVVMFGRALKTQKIMVPRMFDNRMTILSGGFVALQKQHLEAVKSGDQTAIASTKKALFDFFEENFNLLAYQFVADRSDQFANAGPFDGEGQAFQLVADMMRRNPRAITTFDQLYNELSQRSALSKEATADWVLEEYGRIIAQFDKQFKKDTNPSNITGRANETENNFTRSRNDQMAPFGFYKNGFQTSKDVNNFAAGMASRSHDAVAAGLTNVRNDIDRQINELSKKEMSGIGISVAMKQQALDLHNAKNYDDYRALESRRAKVQGMLENFSGNRQLTDIDNVLSRTIGAIMGSLMSSRTTIVNITTGPFYLGRVYNQTMASYWRSYPMAMWNVWVNNGLFKYGLSAAWGVPKAFTFDLLYGVGEGLYGLGNPATRSVGHFASKAMGRMLDELGTNIYMRVKDYRERVANGDQVHADHRADYDARVIGAWIANGHIHDKPMMGLEKAMLTPAALIEVSLNAINRTLNPTLGDAVINSGASTMMKSSAGPIAMHENALRRIFYDWKKSGYRKFDFVDPGSAVNILTHREMFPNVLRDPLSLRFLSGREDMVNMLRFYRDAGIDFHVKAANFLRELNNGNKKATLLTNEEIDAMVTWAIAKSNRATKTNTPLGMQKNNPATLIARPFQFWNTRTFSTMIEAVALPSQSGKTATSTARLKRIQAMQWGFWSLMVLATALAAASVGVGDEEIARVVSSALYNQKRGYRQPWEREGAKSQAIGWALAASNLIPYVNMVTTAMLNDLPSRASFDPSLVMVEKAKSAAQYVGGVIQSGDPTYRLPEFISGMIPDSRIILNRLESQEGKRELSNIASLARRVGPQDLLRPAFGKGGGVNVTELTPYGNRMANAAAIGDWAAFDSIRNEAVVTAKKLGRPNPEQLVAQIYSARDPLKRVFRTALTPEQENDFFARLSPSDAGSIRQVQQRFRQGLTRIKPARTRSTRRSSRLLGYRSPRSGRMARLTAPRTRRRRIRLVV